MTTSPIVSLFNDSNIFIHHLSVTCANREHKVIQEYVDTLSPRQIKKLSVDGRTWSVEVRVDCDLQHIVYDPLKVISALILRPTTPLSHDWV